MRLYRQTVEDFGLYNGMELDSAQLSDLRIAAGQMSAKMRAVRIVSATSVSKADLEQRLIQKGEQPEQAREAVAWMAELDLVDDQKTAEQIVARCVSKGYGRSRAKQELYEKRIPKQYWDVALENYPDQEDALIRFLQNRLPEDPSPKDVKRAVDALIRRGHSWSAIRNALSQITQEADYFQED